jgi:hypothetical protein
MMDERLKDIKRFYELIGILANNIGGPRALMECSGRLNWPRRGVYFFMEAGENRADSGTGLRVVRIGTHALKSGSGTRLWKRLSQHRGHVRSGGGNHRGSIFRFLVGTALIARHGYDFPTWDDGSSNAGADIRASEAELEREVSKTIGAMQFLWLPIDDAPGDGSARGYIERNAIGLLSNFEKESLDPPSTGWLGRYCSRERVRKSGLWNQNHVNEEYDPGFLDRLEALIGAGDKA